jgi:RNAse (barnase) inhibitor barstar
MDIQTLLDTCADPASEPLIAAGETVRDPGLRPALREAGWFVATLDRAPIISKDTLLHAVYQAAMFPGSFGFNWDALHDALTDLTWLEPVQGIALIWRNPGVLKTRAPEVYDTFVDILLETQADRVGAPPLRVISD